MRLVTSLLTLAAAAAASPLLSQQDGAERVWLNTLPSNVTFECRGRIPGYYADVESGCQMYHMCDPQSRRYSYLCPAYTEFSQFYMTCVQHDRVNCSMSESFFHMNEMIGQPRTRFHDLRQHDHSKKKDTEGSKATNQVDASEPAGHVLFEFETKMDVKLEKVQRSRHPERTREGATSRGDAVDSHRANERRLPATRAPPRVPQPHRLFKTLSPPRDSENVTEPSSARSAPSSSARGSESANTARRVRPRVRFSAFAGNTATTPAPERMEEEAEEEEEDAPSSEDVPPLPRNTYRTFGLPGSFSFGTLLMSDKKPDATSTPEPVARSPWATAAPPTSARTTDAPSTKATTRATTTRRRSNTASPVFGTSSATTEAAKTENNVTTTSRPLHTRPRARLTTAAETVTTARTSARSSTEATPTRSPTTPVTTPKPTTTSTTTQRATTERTTAAPTTTTTETTTAKATTPDRWSRRTTEATTPETTTRSSTTEPTTTTRTTTASTTLPTRAASHSTSRTSQTPAPSTALPSVPPSSAGTRRPLHSAPSVPSLLGKELPPIEELEALRLSFTLDPPKLAVKADGPHEERNMKVRGELITGEMALRKLMVDQLKPVYFPNPSLPLNLLPPLLSEQAEEDGGQTTTLTLPVRRQRPDALLQAAAVAFNILPPELASLVPPLLTPPPPPLPSTGATAATSTADSESHHEKPTKDRSNLTMKFGKKKTRFRDDDSHGSPNDACYPCMKSFVKDLDRCHPCVIIR